MKVELIMGNLSFKEKIRPWLEAGITVLLFSTQTILAHAGTISLMAIPLLPYLINFPWGQTTLSGDIEVGIKVYFFDKMFIVGRIIALAGLIVFLISTTQFLLNRYKRIGLMRTGLYSHVRHPQFLGIIITTLGLTIIALTWTLSNLMQTIELWLIQVIGYICIARYEESHLLKRFGENFSEYKRDIPFMFPVRHPHRISEIIFTILIAVLICFLLLIFPYNLIRLH